MLAALVCGLSLASSQLLPGSFRSLDEERSRRELNRVLQSMNENLATLRSFSLDWGCWDETYQFVAAGDPGYVDRNLADASLTSNGQNLLALLDTRGRRVNVTSFDLETGTRTELPAELDSLLRSIRPYPPETTHDVTHAGVCRLRQGPFLLATAPILTSQLEGPCRGTIVVGRWFDPGRGARPEGGATISIRRLPDAKFARSGHDAVPDVVSLPAAPPDSTSSGPQDLVRSFGERILPETADHRAEAEALTWDFFAGECVVVRASVPGEAHAVGRRAVHILLVAVLGVGCIIGLLILTLLERNVLSRIGRLHGEVTAISAHGEFGRGLTVTGRDEMSGLTSAINDLLLTLDTSLTAKEKVLQELQRAKAETEGVLRAKSRFLSTMSHEIRTPMGAIYGMVGLLLDTPLNDEQREHALIVQGGADNLLHILDDILDLSKVEQGRMTLDDVDFDLRETVENAAGLLAWSAAQKGVEIVVAVEPALPGQVRGDPMRVRQILSNLLGNAVKFTAKGEIGLEVTAGDAGRGERTLCFAVRDTGVGIVPDRIEAIFDEFTQEDQSTTRRFGGTGLGLAISRRLAKLMGGSLTAESAPGQGSTFRFTMPLRAADSSRPETLPANGRRVLLADDSEWNRAAMAALLRSWGCLVREAGSSAEALAIVEAETAAFDVCLVDRRLPDRDGLELAGEIQQSRNAMGAAPVFLLCQPGESPRELDIALFGVVGIIAKPIRCSRLRADLRRLWAIDRAAGSPDLLSAGLGSSPVDLALSSAGSGPLSADSAPSAADPVPPPPGYRVLIVDDNEVNRRVARRMVEKAGGRVEEADGGEAALELWRRQPFDLVLMDVQMPGMDGYQATAAIRAEEAARGTRIPILALTAHALTEDRGLCLDAGMDAHLGKPIRFPDLVRAISAWIKPTKEELAMEENRVEEPLHLERMAEISDGDAEFEKDLVGEFLRTAPVLIENALQAVTAGDAVGVQRAAHTLKGAAGSIGAGPLAEASAFLEETSKAGRLEEATPRLQQIQQRFDELSTFVLGYYGELAA
jgi:signal transduction histidine kinase/CheY-like chemotaxis protein/sensor domain CHASE-containing protein/HPt (histidine-containing phosphotransfer) domain-containing protein